MPVVEKDINVIEDQIIVNAFPHQWYKGEALTSNSAAKDPNAKGKEVANHDI